MTARVWIGSTAVTVLFSLTASSARGDNRVICEQEAWLRSSPMGAFGWSVSAADGVVVVGAPYDGERGDHYGAAFVYEKKGGQWRQRQALTGIVDGRAELGRCVATNGQWIFVAAPHHGMDRTPNRGRVFSFRRDERGDWAEHQTFGGTENGTQFGIGLSLTDQHVAMGATGDQTNGSSSGAVYTYRLSGGYWGSGQKLTAPDGEAFARFGSAVDISGDTLIVGAYGDDESGSAYVYVYGDGGWEFQQKLRPLDGDLGDYFGRSVAIDGDLAVAGAYYHGDSGGAVYVYRRTDNVWSEGVKVTPSDVEGPDWFGYAVDLGEGVLAVGSRQDRDGGLAAGSVRLFTFDGDRWNEDGQLRVTNGRPFDHLGSAIAIFNHEVFAGATGIDRPTNASGAAYRFDLRDSPCCSARLRRSRSFPDRAIDARQEHAPGTPREFLGRRRFRFEFSQNDDVMEACFSIQHTGLDVLPEIAGVTRRGERNVVVRLTKGILPGEWTTITYNRSTPLHFGFLPGDVNQDGTTTDEDADVLAECLDQRRPCEPYQYDMNRNGVRDDGDLERFWELLDHHINSPTPWRGRSLPPRPSP